jgi:hypothetical protein
MTHRCPQQLVCSLLACFCVAVMATTFYAGLSRTTQGQGSLQFAVGIDLLRWTVLAQFLTPLAIWGLLTLLSPQPMR